MGPLVRLVHWSLALCIGVNAVLTDPEGAAHEAVGYAALALVGLRLVWGLVARGPARLAAFWPAPRAALRHLRAVIAGDRTVHLGHNPLGALMVWNLWATVGVIGATGIMMGMIRFFGVAWVEALHEAAFNWLMVSVALHVGGVVYDSVRSGVPLVRAMIDGRKRIPEDRPTQ